MDRFNAMSFIWRLLFALVLVFLTYNPSGYSYVHWFSSVFPDFTPYVAIAGLLLLIGWIIYLRATYRALGPLGIGLSAAVAVCLVWLLVYWGVLTLGGSGVITWLVLIIIALVLAIGMSWSHIRRRMTGQVDMDDLDEH